MQLKSCNPTSSPWLFWRLSPHISGCLLSMNDNIITCKSSWQKIYFPCCLPLLASIMLFLQFAFCGNSWSPRVIGGSCKDHNWHQYCRSIRRIWHWGGYFSFISASFNYYFFIWTLSDIIFICMFCFLDLGVVGQGEVSC